MLLYFDFIILLLFTAYYINISYPIE